MTSIASFTKPQGKWLIPSVAFSVALGCEQTVDLPPIPLGPDASAVVIPDVEATVDAAPTEPDAGFARPDTGSIQPDSGAKIGPCSPALTVQPEAKSATPLGLINFQASGGTGAHVFELAENNSGAVLNIETGAYLSGTVEQTTDTIHVTDLGCTGTATATVNVLSRIEVRPQNATIDTNGQVQFEVFDGSGQFSYRILPRPNGASTGTISASGLYMGNGSAGQERIRIEDILTGDAADALIELQENAVLQPVPSSVYMPVETEYVVQINGGSGFFDITPSNTNFSYANGTIKALAEGDTLLSVTDRYTSQTSQISAFAVPSLTSSTTRSGSYINSGAVVRTGDINQDGFDDVAVAWAETNYNATDSGAVLIYQGTATGLDPTPVRVLSEGGRSAQFGRSMTIADLDGDGLLDLIVGAMRADIGARDNGGVYIFSGQPNSFFSAEPTRAIGGTNAFDYAGTAVEACDFNADGYMDIAIGAILAEDRLRRTRSNDQGAVYIHMGGSDGFSDTPDVSLWGDMPLGDGTFAGRTSLQLGRALAAGDFNGDAVCDLAAGTFVYDAGPTNTDDGLLFIYRGRAADGSGPGGLTPFPVRGYAATVAPERSSQFARFMAAGDLDGDLADELVVTQFRAENAAAGGTNRGAIRIYQELDLPDTPMLNLSAVETATLSWFGANNNDEAGWYVRVSDYDGDTRNDLIVGNHSDEIPGGRNNAGTIFIFEGEDGILPDTATTTPMRVIVGPTSENRFGMFFDVVGDLDRDGRNDLVALSAYSDVYGINEGAPFFVPGDESKPLELLGLPGSAGGDQFGISVDFVGDVNGDNITDFLVGAHARDIRSVGINAGGAALYFGTANGFGTQPDVELDRFRRHSGGDHFGFSVSRVGDFDNDGTNDFAVVARYDDQPSSFNNSTYDVIGTTCGPSKNNSGAVFIFRGDSNGNISSQPAYIYYGPHRSSEMYAVVGDVDVNGDGFDDVIVSGVNWDAPGINNSGGFTILHGRAPSNNGRTQIICDVQPTMYGISPNSRIGHSLGKLGDLNRDGCDEFVVGSREEDNGSTNQGTIRIVFGAGINCDYLTPQLLTLESRSRFSRAGTSLSGGLDIDSDGLPDLAVGGNEYRLNGNVVGAVWIILGSYLQTLTPEPIENASTATFYGFSDPSNQLVLSLPGSTGSGNFGNGVTFIPNFDGQGRVGLAVGVPYGDYGGTSLAGDIQMYEFIYGVGLNPFPVASFIGQTNYPGGRPGHTLSSAQISGATYLGVGALDAARDQNFCGAAYLLELKP
ncbi:MAG: FG-GAP-like repeat-containing protein [Myxococcota bacterium]|nr:FG-GAP-like repeat-containing protein [Myxococcota bacterium]